MNRKQIAALAVVVVAMAITLFKLNQGKPAESPPAPRTAAASNSAASSISATTPADETKSHKKPRPPEENEELVARYGDSRTSLSKQVAGNMVGLLEDAVAMGEMATSGELKNAFGGAQPGLRAALGPLFNELKLDDQQIEKAATLHREFQVREIGEAKIALEKLRGNPVPLMTLMLASDATSQGKLTAEEFKQVQTETSADLSHIVNPLDRKNFSGGKPMKDDQFSNSFREILTNEQTEVLQSSLDAQAAATENPQDGNITELPPMELEKLDQAVTSGKAITSGLKQMMEGIGSLQQLGPLPEPLKTSP